MKVTIEEREKYQNKEYPKLMTTESGCIILATGESDTDYQGVCLVSGGTISTVGQFSRFWAGDLFEDFHGTITLENE